MSSLTGSSISGTYGQLLALPGGGGGGPSGGLKALTDGNGATTFALQISADGIKSTGTLEVTGTTTLNSAVTAMAPLTIKSSPDIGSDAALYFKNDDSTVQWRLMIDESVSNNLVIWDDINDRNVTSWNLSSKTMTHLGPLTIGASGGGAGHDVIFYGQTNNEYCMWDESRDDLILTSGCHIGLGDTSPAYPLVLKVAGEDCIATFISEDNDSLLYLTAGDTGDKSYLVFKCENDDSRGMIYYDHHGTPASQKMVFAAGDNSSVTAMTILGDGKVGIGTTAPNTGLHVAGSFAVSGPSESPVTFAAVDDSPSVATGNLFISGSSTETINSFDDGVVGQIITIYSNAAITYSHDAGNLSCGTHDIVTAAGDITRWVKYSTNWHIISWIDHSENLSGAGGF